MHLKYFHKLLENGVFIAPSQFECCFLSGKHSKEDIDKTLEAMEIAFKEFALRKNLNLNRWEKTDEGYKGNFISVTIDLTDNDLKALGIKELVDNCENYGKCKEIARNAINDMINEKGRNNQKEKTFIKE